MKSPLSARLLALTLLLLPLSARAELVAWYPFDEPAGDTGTTSAEFTAGNDALTIGYDPNPAISLLERGHASARPDLGTAYLLNKGSGFDLGAAAAVQPTDKFTFSFWIQPLTHDAFDRIIESANGNGDAQSGMRIDLGTSPGNHIRVQLRDNNGATNTSFQHPLDLKDDGTWYFFAFRYDPSAPAPPAGEIDPRYRLTVIEETGAAVDDAAILAATTAATTVNTGAMGFPHAQNTFIGVQNNAAATVNALHAGIDELAFFDDSDGAGVLSDAQLADVYNHGPSGVDLITSFDTDLSSVNPGSAATLSWEVADPLDSLILDDGLGNTTDLLPLTTAGEGSFMVTPTGTTTYYLRATSGTAANVSVVSILAGAAPDIASFATDSSIIQAGGSATLSWNVVGANTITLDPGATDVSALTTTSVSPTATTTYTLSATNTFGTSTADVTVAVTTGPIPAHRYAAITAGNSDTNWRDQIASNNWALTGAMRNDPLLTPSANTNIAAAYTTTGAVTGGSTSAFQYAEFTAEIWLRPGGLTADHQLIFETGGGQNGLGVLMTDTEFRFIGSAANMRTMDFTIPIGNLNTADFMQLVITNNTVTDAFEVSIRDTFGRVVTATETADIVMGGNGAGLFIHASGGLGGDFNLGGRTELAGQNPTGLTGFTGEIGLVNIYDSILDATAIEAAFDEVATTTAPPVLIPFDITAVSRDAANDTLTVTFDSIVNHLFDAEVSTDGITWTRLNAGVVSVSDPTTATFTVPAGEATMLLRIVDLGED